jgi:hypothetical protein
MQSVWKCKDSNTKELFLTCFCMSVKLGFSDEGKYVEIEDIREEFAEKIWTQHRKRERER